MPIEILMPALSPTMTEGNLVKWLVSEGAQVSAGDIMAEIETDKATMEVEAVDEGTIGKILVTEGTENVQVNSVIAILLEEGEDVATLEGFEPSAPAAESTPAEEKTSSDIPVAADVAVADVMPGTGSSDAGARVFATPLARRLAADKGLQLENIQGSGPHGRIVQSDVEAATAGGTMPSKTLAPLMPASSGQSFEDRPISNMRKVIAKRLLESKQTVPHFYLTIDVKIDELLQVRKRINEGLVDEKITVNDFIIRAIGLALRDVPDANASWLGDAIRYYQQADVAVAVAIDDGLITPIVKSANLKSILMISREVKELVGRAKTGKLKPEEFQGGTFSISNLGMFGVKEFSAIINPPQACILAVGAGKPTPVLIDGEVVGATVMSCTLSVDHRVVDGKIGAELLAAFKRYMENPLLMMA